MSKDDNKFNESNLKLIKIDSHRTFPHQSYFQLIYTSQFRKELDLGLSKLCRILSCISLYFPKTGYCQAMNFIVGFLLMIHGGNEQDTFWNYVYLAQSPHFLVNGFFDQNFPLSQLYLFIFKSELKIHLRKIYKQLFIKLQDQIPDELWIFKWFRTIFIYNFPLEIVIKFWDLIMCSSLFTAISLSLAILENYSQIILSTEDSQDFYKFLEKIKINSNSSSNEYYLDVKKVIKNSKKFKILPSKIANYAKQFKEAEGKQFTLENQFYFDFYSIYNQQNSIMKNVLYQQYIHQQNTDSSHSI